MSARNSNSSLVEIPANVPVIDVASLGRDWKEIGEGGFGKVYKAKHHRWGWDVAVKLLGSDDGSFSDECMVKEAELMQRAENPYVMKVLGLFKGCKPNGVFMQVGMVMELMENGSLSSLQEKLNHLLPWPLVFRLVHQVALGMNYLHSLTPYLIHKDLKPANILLDTGLNVKITDFGLARFATNKTADHLKGACTLFYAPPEAFSGLKGGATCAYDVYSYAMLLWSILNTGQKYENLSFTPPLGERPPLDYINGMQAAGLEELVKLMKRCWSQLKEDRPSFAECTVETEPLYQKHKNGIPQAICQVQMELVPADQRPVPSVPGPVVPSVPGPVVPSVPGPVVPSVPGPVVPPVPPQSTNREDFLKHACSLSMDPSSKNNELSLSEDNRTVTSTELHHHPDNLDRFTEFPQVMSSERLPARCYFEIKWSGRLVSIAVCYQDINRKDKNLSGFGRSDKSVMLFRNGGKYWVMHNSHRKEVGLGLKGSNVSGSDDDGGVFGVYVGDTPGIVSFYSVSDNRMSLLHTINTDATQPLYAGIYVPDLCTAEVCKIW